MAVQVVGMEADQMEDEARVLPVTVEDQGVAMKVQTADEAVKMVRPTAEVVAILQEVQVADHLHVARIVVIAVKVGLRVHLQEAAVVLPEMEGAQDKRKVVLLHAAGEILVNPAKKNRAQALFFLFINF